MWWRVGLLGGFGVFVGWGGAMDAAAYILPGKYYLNKMLKRRRSFRSFRVVQQTTSFQGKKKQVWKEVISIRKPGWIRLEQWQKGRVSRIQIWRQRKGFSWKQGESWKSMGRSPQPRFDFFAVHRNGLGYGEIRSLFRYVGIRTSGVKRWSPHSDYRIQKRVSLTWAGEAPAVVFGAGPRDRTSNQFWVGKNCFCPVRFLGRLKSKGPQWDVRFLEYFRNGLGRVFPGRTEVFRNGRLWLHSVLIRVKVNPKLAKSLFEKAK